MKLCVFLVFTFLYVQVFASFYGQFRGAMSSVERGFGKLITDVVIDVKNTLHCTISAVEQVLAMNGIIDVSSDYNNRCRFAKPKLVPKERDDSNTFLERRFKYTEPRLSPESELEHISQELESSIVNVNKSINDILSRREVGNFKVISELLKDETYRLNAVSELLERELGNISINIRNEILKQRIGRRKPLIDTIWEDLQTLNDFKDKSNNKTEINEINNIIHKVENELQVTPSDKVLSDREKMEEIRKQLNKYTSEKQNDQTPNFNKELENKVVENEISTEKEIKSLKDLAQNIMKNDNKIADSNIGQVFKLEAAPEVSKTEKTIFAVDMALLDSASPFYSPNTITETQKIVEDAKSIMEESKKSEELINNFFKEHQNSDTDIFSNSDIFNFG